MKPIRANWSGAILVCGKCAKKAGGYGPKHRPLAKALRRALGLGKGRKASLGVVETRCLGICPKRGVTLIDTRRPGEWRVVDAGADVDVLAEALRTSVLPRQGEVAPKATEGADTLNKPFADLPLRQLR